MRKTIFTCLVAFMGLLAFRDAWGLAQEDNLLHRWTFQDYTEKSFVDEVGGATLQGYGTVHNVWKNTNGTVPGIRIGDAAKTDSLGYLFCDSGALDLAGREKWTVEAIFSCTDLTTSSVTDYANLIAMQADFLDSTNRIYGTHGWSLKNVMGATGRSAMTLRNDSGGGITDASVSGSSAYVLGSLHKAAWVCDSLSTNSIYFNALDDATVGSAESTTATRVQVLDGIDLYVGDPFHRIGELHLVELRIYGAALSADSLNANHTLDITQYGTTTPIDIWVDSSVSDEGYGTYTSPLKTLSYAMKRITRGSTVRFKAAGDYAGFNDYATSTQPSSVTNITLLGLAADPDGVVIKNSGVGTTDYCFNVTEGSFSLRYLTFDGDSIAAYNVFAAAKDVTSLAADNCTFTDTKSGASIGTGIMSRAVLTVVDSCAFSDLEEHGVYLRNYQAAADYTGSSVTNCTFSDIVKYAVQISNEGDTTRTFNGVVLEHNTVGGAVGAYSGGFYLGGTDSALVRFNTIDLSAVEDNGYGISFGGSGTDATGGDNGYIFNNDLIGCNIGIYGGGAGDTPYKSYGMTVANNYITGSTTAFSPNNAALYNLRNCISYDCTTGIETDSLGCLDQQITTALRRFGGYGTLPGLNGSTSGFYPVGALTPSVAAATPSDPIIQLGGYDGFRSPDEAFLFIRNCDLGTGYTLSMPILNEADLASWELWLHGTGTTGDGTTSGTTWQDAAIDTLKVRVTR
jgi:hypothetical protein